MRSARAILVCVVAWSCASTPILGQVVVLREGAEAIAVAVGRYLGTKTASETAKEIAKIGGKEVVEGLARRTVAEGGDQALKRVVTNTTKYGPDYVRVLGRASSPVSLVGTLDELPADSVQRAIGLLGKKGSGEALQSIVEKAGVRALEADLAHPGIGASLVETLGDDGYRLATTLGGDDAITLARCAPAIGKLPQAEKASVLKLLHDDAAGMVSFMGRFIEKNPGKVLFTPAATIVILANSERLLGGDDIVLDAEGNPVVVSKPGLLERGANGFLDRLMPFLITAMALVSVGAMVWLGVRLFYVWQHERLRLERAKQEAQSRIREDGDSPARRDDRSGAPKL